MAVMGRAQSHGGVDQHGSGQPSLFAQNVTLKKAHCLAERSKMIKHNWVFCSSQIQLSYALGNFLL
jgi:hypothetical protein